MLTLVKFFLYWTGFNGRLPVTFCLWIYPKKDTPDLIIMYGPIPCEWLLTGRRQHTFRSLHTYPCRLSLFRSPVISLMPDTRSRMFRIRYTFPCPLLLPNLSLHGNSFRWTDVDTGLAVKAHFLVDFCFFILYGDCRRGAFIYAGLASGTSIGVNDCNQLIHSIVYVG